MSNHNSTSTDQQGSEAQGSVRHVDPGSLIIGANVRLDAATDKEFVGSVRSLGVLEPIVATEGPDGALCVRYGQRRTLAAIEAGRATVPVYVVEGTDDEAGQARRIVEQLAENDHRAAITDRDRLAAYEQLTGFGMSAAQVAKATGRARKEVQHAVAVTGSELASRAAERWSFLTLADAALIAEFEDDAEDVQKIVAAAERGEATEHVAQRIRDDRAEAAEHAAAVAALTEAGVPVVERPRYDERTVTALRHLRATPDAAEAITAEEHAACPGHAAYLERAWRAETETQGWEPVYVCTDPKTNGHTKRDPYGNSSTARQPGPMSEDEKAARREVIENNKAWDAAEQVRAEWLREWAKGATAPKGVETYLAVAIAHGESNEGAAALLGDLAGAGKAGKAAARAALRLAAANLLASWHARAGRHTWWLWS